MKPYGDVFAELYDRFFGDYAEKAAFLLLSFFGPQVGALHCSRVLDLGCGTGRLAERFLEAGYEVTGLDLSLPMLALAQKRCSHYLAEGKAQFLQADMSNFEMEERFGLAVSTYNAMNHLDSEQELRGCFEEVKHCLAPGGLFLFDFHTSKGLEEWAAPQSIPLQEGNIEVLGSYDKTAGRAALLLKGTWKGRNFEEKIHNRTFPLGKVARLLLEVGFSSPFFTRIDDLGAPLPEPENEKRVFVLARSA